MGISNHTQAYKMSETLKKVQQVEDTYERLYKVDECSVCMNDLTSDLVTFINCGHIFHSQCAKDSVEATHKCPDCRAEAVEADIKALHFNIDNKENEELWQNFQDSKIEFKKVKGVCEKAQDQNEILENKCEHLDTRLRDSEEKHSKLQKKFTDNEKKLVSNGNSL